MESIMISITYDQVAEIIEALKAEGIEKIGAKKIRERLGTGSNSTIQKHLNKWIARNVATPRPGDKIIISEDLVVAFETAVNAKVVGIKVEYEAIISEIKETLSQIINEAEEFEARLRD